MTNYAQRNISKVWTVQHQYNSLTHKAGMVLEPGNWQEYDPFLFLAEDWFQKGTFDFHPHRGMETVTYVIDGKLEHRDNHGGKGLLLPGDVQWMTAGSGIIHAEEPLEGETVHSLQLWLNLPRSNKMAEPRYQDIKSDDAPVRREDGAIIRVFSGSSGDIKSNTKNYVPVTMVEIILEEGGSVIQDLPVSYNGFIYIIEGEGRFGESDTYGKQNQVLWLGSAEGDDMSGISLRTKTGLRALVYAGEPVGEPVVARGPFVMNTEEEIRKAHSDYFAGKFEKNG